MTTVVNPSLFYNAYADKQQTMISSRVMRYIAINRDDDFANKGILKKILLSLALEVTIPFSMAAMIIESLTYLLAEVFLFLPNKFGLLSSDNSLLKFCNGGTRLGIQSLLSCMQLAVKNLIIWKKLVYYSAHLTQQPLARFSIRRCNIL